MKPPEGGPSAEELKTKHLGHTQDYQLAFSELLHQKLNGIAKQGCELTHEKYLVDLMSIEVQWERAQLLEIAKGIRLDLVEIKSVLDKLAAARVG